jgi:hypothetical protein
VSWYAELEEELLGGALNATRGAFPPFTSLRSIPFRLERPVDDGIDWLPVV